ncbi:MAG: RtcB family protein [Leptospiraceae bacterium]|nr:RtcB family protein [Leptospiraceae bacterium]MDW7975096.1 RtcB family protein [Leptospiraceae bacterium]
MIVIKEKDFKVPLKIWTDLEEIEEEARQQLYNIARLPWVFHHVSVMPDVHFGKGATVGSVIAMKDAISPAAVGVDIGCGMAAIKTNIKAKELPDSLRPIRLDIEKAIPVGFDEHKIPVYQEYLPESLLKETKELFKNFYRLTEKVHNLRSKAEIQLGTLGGGNHFIELCLDTEENVWLMLHSGSRHIGHELANYHIERAKKLAHNQNLPDPDLAVYLEGTKEMEEYKHDLYWAQRYAYLNRNVMLEIYKKVLQKYFPHLKEVERIVCHHNYVAEEIHFGEKVYITRKGAIRAKKGEMGIIPGSMGAKSYIVRGLGNPESYESASHGAGRRISRNKAKKLYTEKDLIEQTRGVESRKDKGILDEIPAAYKDIDKVMEQQKDLVEIVYELKQVLCVKG